MAHVCVKIFTSYHQDNANHVTLQVPAGHVNHKLNVLNATCTKGTKKTQSTRHVFAEGNFPQSTTLVSSVTSMVVKDVSKWMFVCLVQSKMGMKQMWEQMECVSRRILTQSSLFGRLSEGAWSCLFWFMCSVNAEGNSNFNEKNWKRNHILRIEVTNKVFKINQNTIKEHKTEDNMFQGLKKSSKYSMKAFTNKSRLNPQWPQ